MEKHEKEFFYFVKTQLGFIPNNIYIYKKALTHKSANIKLLSGKFLSNERLEFLGDSIMDAVISEYLFCNYPQKDEGYLTQMRSKIVNRKMLNEIAFNIKLHKHLNANMVIESDNNNILGNAFEALIGAIFIDKGYLFTKNYIIEKIIKKYYDFNFLETVDTNFKSRLIEFAQKKKKAVLFDTKEEPSIEKGKQTFNSSIYIDNFKICEAYGPSKKEAEQNASKKAISFLNQ